jgi:hypothetical protein
MSRTAKPNADFDFLMGTWKCRHRYLVRRLADCHDWIEFDGSCEVRKILDGFGNMDENDIELPGDRYCGMSLRTWDPDSKRWSIYWLDSRRPGHCFRRCTAASRRASAPFAATIRSRAVPSA